MSFVISARRFSCVGISMGVLAGCTAMTPTKLVSDAALHRGFAISAPTMQACDELACHYSGVRHFHVRDIHCLGDVIRPTVCDYERAETESPFPELPLEAKRRLGIAEPGEVENVLSWKAARSRMYLSENGYWRIVADTAE